jgi:predicted anti-sigma-YlaC factor YlaD
MFRTFTACLSLFAALALASGCSIKRMAANSVGASLVGSGGTFSSDNDPELVRDALPFSLKLIETLLDISPDNRNLLLAACKYFTMYSYAFVDQEADKHQETDYAHFRAQKVRARNLYLRAKDYGLRGLEDSRKDFASSAKRGGENLQKALSGMKKKDVELLYWTGMAWTAGVNLGKDDPALMVDLSSSEALIFRAFDLDPDFDNGAIHSFLVTYMGSRPEAMGGSKPKAREHFEKVVALTQGLSAGPYVSWAESLSIPAQDRAEFQTMLKKALAVDVDKKPDWRLQNLIYQNRAKWLLSQEDDLFVD